MHVVLVNRLGGLSLPRKSVVRLTDRRDMTLDVYRGQEAWYSLIWMHCLYYAFFARLDEVQEELLYYPGVGGDVGIGKMLKFLR